MMGTAAMAGALTGLALGLASFLFCRALARRVELEDTRRALRVSGLVQLAALPLLGWSAGLLFSGD